jgi:hypothetical protein
VGLLVNVTFLVGLLPLVVLLAVLMTLMAWIPIVGLVTPRQRLADSLGSLLRRYNIWWARSSARLGLHIYPARAQRLSPGTRVLRVALGVAVSAIFLAVFMGLALATSFVWLIPVLGWMAVGKALSIYLGIWQMSAAFFGVRVRIRGAVRPTRVGIGQRPGPLPVPNLPKGPRAASGHPGATRRDGLISTASRTIELGVPVTIAPIERLEDPQLQRAPGWVMAAVQALARLPMLPQLARTSEIALLPYAERVAVGGELPRVAWSLSAASLAARRQTSASPEPVRADGPKMSVLPDGAQFVFAPWPMIPSILAQHLPQTAGVWVITPAAADAVSSGHALHFSAARLGYRGDSQRQGVVALAPGGLLRVLAPPGSADMNLG